MTFGWGILGIGQHADARVAPAIVKAKDTRLAAVWSRDKTRAAAFAAKHGAGKSYDSLDEIMRDPNVDVIYIATPNNLHAQHTIMAARAGKHVLCEKPMALTLQEGEQMIEACRRSGVKLGICFQNRHHPAHVEARRLILSGGVGEITLATAQYCHGWFGPHWKGWRAVPEMAGGGALMGTGLHPIDLLRFLIGKEVAEVKAFADEDWEARKVDDQVLVILRFQDGPNAIVISGGKVPRSYNHVVIYGTKARITGENTVGMPLRGKLHVSGDNISASYEFPCEDEIAGNYILQVESFNRAIEANIEPNASGYDGLEAIRLATAILESSRQGKPVQIGR